MYIKLRQKEIYILDVDIQMKQTSKLLLENTYGQ